MVVTRTMLDLVIKEMQKEIQARVLLVFRIGLVLIGDATIFVLWLFLSYGCSKLCASFKERGLNPHVETCFLFVAHWGVFSLAVGFILCDIVGVIGEIQRRWRKERTRDKSE